MKLIFLDVDGVLNNRKAFKKGKQDGFPHGPCLVWDPDCINRLNNIIEKTGAKIVVSSTWRLYNDAYKVLTEVMGIKGEFIGCTPDHIRRPHPSSRGGEINEWLTLEKLEKSPFVILDDDSDMDKYMNKLVLTDTEAGLQDREMNKAIEMLNDDSMSKYKNMTITDYMSLVHKDNRDQILENVSHRRLNGETFTIEELDNEFNQTIRLNDSEPKIGEIAPIMVTTQKDTKEGEIDTLLKTLEAVMIIGDSP